MIQSWLSSSRWLWLLCVWAVLPFFLRLSLDYSSVERQGVLSLYRAWRLSPGVKDLKPGSDLVFESLNPKDRFEESFRMQLARDFRVLEQGEATRVRAFFHLSGQLHARIESPGAWTGSVRLVNNGFLLGFWVALLMVFLGLSRRWMLWGASLTVLFWYSHWNVLGMPVQFMSSILQVGTELWTRFQTKNWVATELGRVAELYWVLCLPLMLGAAAWDRWSGATKYRWGLTMGAGLVLEPALLFVASRFAQWGPETSWLRIYIGSFGFRFLFLGMALYALLDRGWVKSCQERWSSATSHLGPVLTSGVLVVSGLWAWGQSALYPEPSDTVVRLKVFGVGFLMALITGSRIFSLGIGILLLAVILPPSRGHLQAASLVGLAFDSLLLGWVLSPFKSYGAQFLMGAPVRHFVFLSLSGWLFGVLLSSVGIPLVACWGLFLFAVWAYAQLSDSPAEAPAEAGSQEPLR